jgi:hypothetical protein
LYWQHYLLPNRCLRLVLHYCLMMSRSRQETLQEHTLPQPPKIF